MFKSKSSVATLVLGAVFAGTLTLSGCTANNLTGAELENPSAVQTEAPVSNDPTALPVSAAETSHEYNGADVNQESDEVEDEASSEEDEPLLSTDPRSRYND